MTPDRLEFIRHCVKTQTPFEDGIVEELLQYIDELKQLKWCPPQKRKAK